MPRRPDSADDLCLNPDPSVVWVEGRSPILYWDPPSRREFGTFLALAEKYGLHVHEADAQAPDEAPRRYATKIVYLDEALAAIKLRPGISFNEWARAWEDGAQKTEVDRRKARARAAVALSKLYREGKVHKYRTDEGGLILFPYGMGPLRRDPFAPPPPEIVIAYRDRPEPPAETASEPAE